MFHEHNNLFTVQCCISGQLMCESLLPTQHDRALNLGWMHLSQHSSGIPIDGAPEMHPKGIIWGCTQRGRTGQQIEGHK